MKLSYNLIPKSEKPEGNLESRLGMEIKPDDSNEANYRMTFNYIDGEYLPETDEYNRTDPADKDIVFVIQYSDPKKNLMGFTSFSKDEKEVYIPVQPGGMTNAVIWGYTGIELVRDHERGHNSPQRPYETTPQKEEAGLRAERGEQY